VTEQGRAGLATVALFCAVIMLTVTALILIN